MREYLIYQHLGLGDHIVCNGLVREICKQNGNFFIVSKPQNYESVKFMFRDIPNLTVIKLTTGGISISEDPQEVYTIALKNNLEVIKIGHEFLDTSINFDTAFYRQFNLPLETRWFNFKVVRDYNREIRLFERTNIHFEYIFIHDDERFKINKNINTNLRIVRVKPEFTDNIFDYLSLIENAKEVHCIETCFMFMIDSFPQFANKKLFCHRYARQYPQNSIPNLKLNWQILI